MVSRKRIIVDTNVIIECFRIGVWQEISQRCQIETVEQCCVEALAGDPYRPGYVAVDRAELFNGIHQAHQVKQDDLNQLDVRYEEMTRLDDGERHLFAWLLANSIRLSDLIVVSTADKGAIVRSNDHPGWMDGLWSLEEVMKDAGVSKAKVHSVGPQHTADFLRQVRTNVRLGLLR